MEESYTIPSIKSSRVLQYQHINKENYIAIAIGWGLTEAQLKKENFGLHTVRAIFVINKNGYDAQQAYPKVEGLDLDQCFGVSIFCLSKEQVCVKNFGSHTLQYITKDLKLANPDFKFTILTKEDKNIIAKSYERYRFLPDRELITMDTLGMCRADFDKNEIGPCLTNELFELADEQVQVKNYLKRRRV